MRVVDLSDYSFVHTFPTWSGGPKTYYHRSFGDYQLLSGVLTLEDEFGRGDCVYNSRALLGVVVDYGSVLTLDRN